MNKALVKFHTASFDVDPQKGFSELCPNELPVPDALEIVGPLEEQAMKARIRVASKDCHNPNAIWVADEKHPQFSKVKGGSLDNSVNAPNVDIRWNRHCEVGTFGHQFLDGLPHPSKYDFIVYKGIENDMHPYGACFHDLKDTRSTGVIEFLMKQAIKNVIVGGLATDYCVKTTALQLNNAGFNVIINLAACRGISKDTIDKALEEMYKAGIQIVPSSDVIESY